MASVFASDKVKLSFAVVLLIGAGILVVWHFSRSGPISKDVNFVCVETGKTYSLTREQAALLPAENPQTHERTLLPCVKRDGVLYVSARYRDSLLQLGERNKYVDTETLAVRTAP